ncbi:gram-negative porin family protein, partial [Vibrio parahaemolyticus V-223/04]
TLVMCSPLPMFLWRAKRIKSTKPRRKFSVKMARCNIKTA